MKNKTNFIERWEEKTRINTHLERIYKRLNEVIYHRNTGREESISLLDAYEELEEIKKTII